MKKVSNTTLALAALTQIGGASGTPLLNQEVLYIDIYLNGTRVEQLVEIERDGSRFLIDPKILTWLPPSVSIDLEQNRVDLCHIPDISCSYDSSSLQLALKLPASYFDRQAFRYGDREVPELSRLTSTLLNYDIYYSKTDNNREFVDLFHQLRHSGTFGVFETRGLYRPQSLDNSLSDIEQSTYTRLESFWQYNDEYNMRVYRAGDLVSAPSILGRQVRMAGVQVLSDFSLDPSFVSYPYPQFIGEAILPSSVDLFINGIRQYSAQVEPGPYEINAGNTFVGLNSATLLTKDFRGLTSTTPIQFYFSPNLLRESVASYSAQIGYLRENYGITSNAYQNDILGIADYAYGVNDRNTVATHFEHSSLHKNVGLEWRKSLGLFGVIGISGSYGSTSEIEGSQWQANYRFSARTWGLFLEHTRRDRGYADVAILTEVSPYQEQSRANLSFSLGSGSLNLAYLQHKAFQRSSERVVSATFSKSYSNFSLNISSNFDLNQNASAISLFISVPFEKWGRTSIRHNQVRDLPSSTVVSFASNRLIDQRFQFNASRSLNDNYQSLTAGYRTNFAELSAGHSRSDFYSNSWLRGRGSVVFAQQELFFSNPIYDGFAIIDTNGFADLPIRKENTRVGRTNHNGKLMVAGLNAYNVARFSVDTASLPLNTSVRTNKSTIATARNMGALVKFDIRQSNAALIIVHHNGEPLAVGSRVFIEGRSDSAIVGWDGEIYLENIEAITKLRIETGESECSLIVSFHPQDDAIPVLGPFECVQE